MNIKSQQKFHLCVNILLSQSTTVQWKLSLEKKKPAGSSLILLFFELLMYEIQRPSNDVLEMGTILNIIKCWSRVKHFIFKLEDTMTFCGWKNCVLAIANGSQYVSPTKDGFYTRQICTMIVWFSFISKMSSCVLTSAMKLLVVMMTSVLISFV